MINIESKYDYPTSLLERAVQDKELAGRGPEALKWLGKAYSRMGARDKAIQSYLRIVSTYPESEWADDALYLAGNVYRDANDPSAAEKIISGMEAYLQRHGEERISTLIGALDTGGK